MGMDGLRHCQCLETITMGIKKNMWMVAIPEMVMWQLDSRGLSYVGWTRNSL